MSPHVHSILLLFWTAHYIHPHVHMLPMWQGTTLIEEYLPQTITHVVCVDSSNHIRIYYNLI